MYLCNSSSEPITGSLLCGVLNIFIEDWVKILWLNTPCFRYICKSVNRKYIVYYIICICEIKGRGCGGVGVKYGVVRVQGMCLHQFYLGRCIKLLKQYTA